MAYSKTIEEFFEKNQLRTDELAKLREILIEFPFEESIKWGMPSYGLDKKNLIGIGSFNNWSCLWFHQGCFLRDKENVLVNAQEGKTSGMRQWRFDNIEEINAPLIRDYLQETIENHKAGKEIKSKKAGKKAIEMPELLAEHFATREKLFEQFKAYSIAQQNEFMNYINEAKREATKLQRIEKIETLINEGKNLNTLWGG